MSLTSLRRWFDRVEIRIAATLLILAAPVLAASLFLSLAYAAHEMLEDRGREVATLADLAAEALAGSQTVRLDGPLYDLIEREEIAIRVLDGRGPIAGRGPEGWFGSGSREADAFWDAVRTRTEDVLVVGRIIGSGPLRLELAAPLRSFTAERAELMRGFWISLFVGLLGSTLFAVVAMRRALQPLREATDAISRVNTNKLQTRLPLRHTGDAVDRHAEALNGALDRLENGFGRIRAFSADVAHELRTPINRLLNQSGSRLLGTQQVDELTDTLLRVQRTAEEMQAIVDGLLLLAQAEEGRLRTQMRELRLPQLLDGLQELYRPACEEKGVRLEIKAEDLAIVGDEDLLVRLLSNLIDNALGHTAAGDRVVVDAVSDDGGVCLTVCDTGPGIPAADLEHVFDRFVRADPTGPRRGAGLGLPIARAIAVAHGGTLRARYTPAGGACLELRLPRERPTS